MWVHRSQIWSAKQIQAIISSGQLWEYKWNYIIIIGYFFANTLHMAMLLLTIPERDGRPIHIELEETGAWLDMQLLTCARTHEHYRGEKAVEVKWGYCQTFEGEEKVVFRGGGRDERVVSNLQQLPWPILKFGPDWTLLGGKELASVWCVCVCVCVCMELAIYILHLV